MLRRFGCILTAIAMIFCLSLSNFAGLTVFADDEETYLTIPTSGGSLSSGIYQLTTDVTISNPLKINSGTEVTIDLNGWSITYSGEYVINIIGGTLNLVDSSEEASGIITQNYGSANPVVRVTSNGIFNMYGGTLYGPRGIYVKTGTVTITSGTITATNNYSVYAYGGSVTISGTGRVEIT
ncbi:MAG: hypothetical protein LUG23_06825 [Oscillospiraceae bacterium]|nr:hypothetical protein [Oscillospiraceae bacterium]